MRAAWRTRIALFAWTAILLVGAAACDRPPAQSESAASNPPTTEPSEADLTAVKQMLDQSGAAPALPPGHPPLDVPQSQPAGGETAMLPPGHPPLTAAPTPAPTPTPQGPPLVWEVPENWRSVTPRSRFRLAQYAIPKVDGDPRDGEVAVFHFPNSGGTVAANLERWAGQFTTADGQPIAPQMIQRETFDVGGLKVHTIELTGYMQVGSMMGGTGQRSDVEYRLLGAIVETPGGHWFFKGYGPAATMAAARADFIAMLKTVHQ